METIPGYQHVLLSCLSGLRLDSSWSQLVVGAQAKYPGKPQIDASASVASTKYQLALKITIIDLSAPAALPDISENRGLASNLQPQESKVDSIPPLASRCATSTAPSRSAVGTTYSLVPPGAV